MKKQSAPVEDSAAAVASPERQRAGKMCIRDSKNTGKEEQHLNKPERPNAADGGNRINQSHRYIRKSSANFNIQKSCDPVQNKQANRGGEQ